mmetsp:Transcript_17868/g.40353  ORF Transcript_17868/g.40353 Transcript_17868/m.40353 type:complete len:84 (-) Transcript_17868:536-787(-)
MTYSAATPCGGPYANSTTSAGAMEGQFSVAVWKVLATLNQLHSATVPSLRPARMLAQHGLKCSLKNEDTLHQDASWASIVFIL